MDKQLFLEKMEQVYDDHQLSVFKDIMFTVGFQFYSEQGKTCTIETEISEEC